MLTLALLTTSLAAPPSGTEIGDRVLEAALVRAQEELIQGLELWEDHSSWEDPWIVTSDNFEVRTVASHFLAADIARGMETMLTHFQELLETDYLPDPPIPIWIYPDLVAYNELGNQYGAEHSSILGAFYADQHPQRPVGTYEVPNLVLQRMWVTHAVIHRLLDDAFTSTPDTYLDEGLASYFSLFWDWAYGAREHDRLARTSAGRFIPLTELLEDPIASYTDRPHDRFMELGMWFAYLLHYREETSLEGSGEASFSLFLQAAVRGDRTRGLGFPAFFDERREELEEDYRAFDFR